MSDSNEGASNPNPRDYLEIIMTAGIFRPEKNAATQAALVALGCELIDLGTRAVNALERLAVSADAGVKSLGFIAYYASLQSGGPPPNQPHTHPGAGANGV